MIGLAKKDSLVTRLAQKENAKFFLIDDLESETYTTNKVLYGHFGSWLIVETINRLLLWVFYDRKQSYVKPKRIEQTPTKNEELKRKRRRVSRILQEPSTKSPQKKIKRESVPCIISESQCEKLKQLCQKYKFWSNRLYRQKIDDILKQNHLVCPNNLAKLMIHFDITKAICFEECNSAEENVFSNTSFYCYSTYRDLNRSSVQNAGKVLTKWYEKRITTSGMTIKDFEKKILVNDTSEENGITVDEHSDKHTEKDASTPKNRVKRHKLKEQNNNSSKKATELENFSRYKYSSTLYQEMLHLSSWTYVNLKTSSNTYRVLLVLIPDPRIVVVLGEYPDFELAETAGQLGKSEAVEYLTTRLENLEKKSKSYDEKNVAHIVKQLKRVVFGRVKRTIKDLNLSKLSDKNGLENKPTMRLRDRKSVKPQNDTESINKTLQDIVHNEVVIQEPTLHDNPKLIRDHTCNISMAGPEIVDNISFELAEKYICADYEHYLSFAFMDNPLKRFKPLDYVCFARPAKQDKENQLSKDYLLYIGQIEAIYIKENRGFARISSFSWPDEAKNITRSKLDGITEGAELFASYEVEKIPLFFILAKVEVYKFIDYKKCSKDSFSYKSIRRSFALDMKNENEHKTLSLKRSLLKEFFFNDYNAKDTLKFCCTCYFDSKRNRVFHEFDRSRFLLSRSILLREEEELILDAEDNFAVDKKTVNSMFDVAKKCSFCFYDLNLKPFIACLVCKGSVFCLDCFAKKRSGVVSQVFNENIKLLHLSSHPYEVSTPQVSAREPTTGISLLEAIFERKSLDQNSVKYNLINIERKRTKLSISCHIYFTFGISFSYNDGKDKKNITVAAKDSSANILHAKGLAAFEMLAKVFGIFSKNDIFLFNTESNNLPALTLMQINKLLKSIIRHGLSWDVISPNIINCSSKDLKQFYYGTLVPAFFNALERSEFNRLTRLERAQLRSRYESEDLFPKPDVKQTTQAIEDSLKWAFSVKRFCLRRYFLGATRKIKNCFAVVNNTTIFQPWPNHFGPLISNATADLYKKHTRLVQLLNKNDIPDSADIWRELQLLLPKLNQPCDEPASFVYDFNRECQKCNQIGISNTIKCKGCEVRYHKTCLEDKSVEFFCDECLEDRAYIYEHVSFGRLGSTLSKIVDKNILYSVKQLKEFMTLDFKKTSKNARLKSLIEKFTSFKSMSENDILALKNLLRVVDFPLPLNEQEWQDNDEILQLAKRKAIQLGWLDNIATTRRDEPLISKELRNAYVLDQDLLNSVDWATRNFANSQIESLRLGLKATCQALNDVTSQRDALLTMVKDLKKNNDSTNKN